MQSAAVSRRSHGSVGRTSSARSPIRCRKVPAARSSVRVEPRGSRSAHLGRRARIRSLATAGRRGRVPPTASTRCGVVVCSTRSRRDRPAATLRRKAPAPESPAPDAPKRVLRSGAADVIFERAIKHRDIFDASEVAQCFDEGRRQASPRQFEEFETKALGARGSEFANRGIPHHILAHANHGIRDGSLGMKILQQDIACSEAAESFDCPAPRFVQAGGAAFEQESPWGPIAPSPAAINWPTIASPRCSELSCRISSSTSAIAADDQQNPRYSITACDTALSKSYCSERPGVWTKMIATICSLRFTHQYVPNAPSQP